MPKDLKFVSLKFQDVEVAVLELELPEELEDPDELEPELDDPLDEEPELDEPELEDPELEDPDELDEPDELEPEVVVPPIVCSVTFKLLDANVVVWYAVILDV